MKNIKNQDSKTDNLRISKNNEVKPEIKKVKKQDIFYCSGRYKKYACWNNKDA